MNPSDPGDPDDELTGAGPDEEFVPGIDEFVPGVDEHYEPAGGPGGPGRSGRRRPQRRSR